VVRVVRGKFLPLPCLPDIDFHLIHVANVIRRNIDIL
jgi:hypothetical protein